MQPCACICHLSACSGTCTRTHMADWGLGPSVDVVLNARLLSLIEVTVASTQSRLQPPPILVPVEPPVGRMIGTANALSALIVTPPYFGRDRWAAIMHSVPHHAVTPIGRHSRCSSLFSAATIGDLNPSVSHPPINSSQIVRYLLR